MKQNTIVFYVHDFNLNSLNFNVGKDPINTIELSNLLLKIFHFFIPAFQSTFQLKLRLRQTPNLSYLQANSIHSIAMTVWLILLYSINIFLFLFLLFNQLKHETRVISTNSLQSTAMTMQLVHFQQITIHQVIFNNAKLL